MGNRKAPLPPLPSEVIILQEDPDVAQGEESAGTIDPDQIPKTGDESHPALWLGLVLLGLTGIGLGIKKRRP